MAILANTFTTASPKGNREELSDVVNRITPHDTPIYSMIGKGSAKSIHPEWEIDELSAPEENAQLEGDEYSFQAIDPVVRVGNYTQIFRKSIIVSATQESVSNAGNAEKIKYQKLKKGVELRKDVEFAIVSATATVDGQTRKFGSLPTWITSNVSRGASGANGGFSSTSKKTVAPTDGTRRAFTKAILDNIAKQCYEEGANVNYIVTSPYVKSVFVGFMSDDSVANFRYQTRGRGKNTIVATADMYEGPYGMLTIMPNRVMSTAATSRNVFFIDTSMLSFKWLRKIKEDTKVAKTGDAHKRVLIGEGTLCIKNEKGLGVAADLFGLTSTT